MEATEEQGRANPSTLRLPCDTHGTKEILAGAVVACEPYESAILHGDAAGDGAIAESTLALIRPWLSELCANPFNDLLFLVWHCSADYHTLFPQVPDVGFYVRQFVELNEHVRHMRLQLPSVL
jgi:hypothetical protein